MMIVLDQRCSADPNPSTYEYSNAPHRDRRGKARGTVRSIPRFPARTTTCLCPEPSNLTFTMDIKELVIAYSLTTPSVIAHV